MPAKDYNAYMRKYMLRRYHERRTEAIAKLGGKCAECGVAAEKENLEFHHKDPNIKKFTIAKMWSVNNSDFWLEISRCELLCKDCHIELHYGSVAKR